MITREQIDDLEILAELPISTKGSLKTEGVRGMIDALKESLEQTRSHRPAPPVSDESRERERVAKR